MYQSILWWSLTAWWRGYDYSLFIGPDNELIGKRAGKIRVCHAGRQRDRPGALREFRLAGEHRPEARAFRSVIEEAGNVRVEQVHVVSESRDSAEDIVRAFGTHLRDIDAIFAHNDYMALGAARRAGTVGLRRYPHCGGRWVHRGEPGGSTWCAAG